MLVISLQTVIAVRINYSQWFKSQKAKKPSRILPPPLPSSLMPCGNQAVNGKHQSSTSEKLEDLKVSMVGLPKESMVTFVNPFQYLWLCSKVIPFNCLWNTCSALKTVSPSLKNQILF